ncbi:uncharacterized protein LOC135211501 [Macrobrachium nipponense]|uniref:uncharacterized protein LOC135211501 n=1 Tax=Macrobrachium nipponense TaxID=159736 RepID=UPI0030C8BCCA
MPRRLNNRVSPEDRRHTIEKYIANEDFPSMAHDLGIKRTTAYTIITHYQRRGSYQTHHGGGRRLSIDNESIDFLVSMIEAEPTIPIKNLNEILREVFPRKQRVSDVTVSRAPQGELITLKLCQNIEQDRNFPKVKEARSVFAHLYESGLQKHRIYLDESGYNLYTKHTYGRAPRGERVHRTVGGQLGGNITLIAAISDQDELVYHEIHTSTVNMDRFKDYFTSLNAILGEEDCIIFMDNAPCHNNISDIFPKRVIRYLPPYSPFLNPIETCFSVIKVLLKNTLNSIVDRSDVTVARQAGSRNNTTSIQGTAAHPVYGKLTTGCDTSAYFI